MNTYHDRLSKAAPISFNELRLPFVNTSFSTDLKTYFVLWPLWWLLGIEQLLPLFFLGWASIRTLIQTNGKVRVNYTALFALALMLWWFVPIFWVDPVQLDVYIRECTIAISQFLILLLCWNHLRDRQSWWRVVQGVEILAFYVALGCLLFVFAIWQQKLYSLIGYLLPASLSSTSAFFESISIRTFGTLHSGRLGLFPYRVSSFALTPADLATLSVILIPFMAWRTYLSEGWLRYGKLLTLMGLFLCFAFAEVRMAYIAIAAGFALFIALYLGLHRPQNRFLIAALVALNIIFLSIGGYILYQAMIQFFQTAFVELRPGSFAVRLYIYRQTFALLPEHFIAGWGTSVRIEEFRSVYSAGTHSGYLAMLFQHGVVGLLLYLGLWGSIWRVIVRKIRIAKKSSTWQSFWLMAAVALFAFNIREITATWLWDQTVTMTLWTLWALILTAPLLQSNEQIESELNKDR